MREICTSGSEGGASQSNGTSLPLFDCRPFGTWTQNKTVLHPTLRRWKPRLTSYEKITNS